MQNYFVEGDRHESSLEDGTAKTLRVECNFKHKY